VQQLGLDKIAACWRRLVAPGWQRGNGTDNNFHTIHSFYSCSSSCTPSPRKRQEKLWTGRPARFVPFHSPFGRCIVFA
jgi:hypothetical protein